MARSVSECLDEALSHLSAAENHASLAHSRLWPVSPALRDEASEHANRIAQTINRVRRAVIALDGSGL